MCPTNPYSPVICDVRSTYKGSKRVSRNYKC